jgi:hypothetical protein
LRNYFLYIYLSEIDILTVLNIWLYFYSWSSFLNIF